MRRRGHISEVNLDALADICGGVTWPYPDQPPRDATARRLLETLGVVGVPMIAAHALAVTRDCVTPLCTDTAERGSDHCRHHAPRTTTTETPMPPETTAGTWSRRHLSRQEALEQMTATLARLPAPPTRNGWAKGKLRPSINAVERIFGTYGDALNACGYGTVLAEREPKAAEERVTPPTAGREPVSSAAVVSKPVTPAAVVADEPASRSANTDTGTDTNQLAQLHADRAQIDAYLATLDESSNEGAKQEARPFGLLMGDFADAWKAYREASGRVTAISDALRAHPEYRAAQEAGLL